MAAVRPPNLVCSIIKKIPRKSDHIPIKKPSARKSFAPRPTDNALKAVISFKCSPLTIAQPLKVTISFVVRPPKSPLKCRRFGEGGTSVKNVNFESPPPRTQIVCNGRLGGLGGMLTITYYLGSRKGAFKMDISALKAYSIKGRTFSKP